MSDGPNEIRIEGGFKTHGPQRLKIEGYSGVRMTDCQTLMPTKEELILAALESRHPRKPEGAYARHCPHPACKELIAALDAERARLAREA